jgi:hypothetical protein
MRTRTLLVAVAPSLLAAGLVVANCTGQMGRAPGDPFDPNDPDPIIGCDPDNPDSCPDVWFRCDVDEDGNKECEGPGLPDGDDGWICVARGATLTCEGDHVPDGDGWVCVPTDDGTVECTRTFVPGGGGDGIWICDDEFTNCVFYDVTEVPGGDGDADSDTDADSDGDIDGGGGDQCPPGVEMPTDEICFDDLDNDCDGETDEDCTREDCLCIPGARRICDYSPIYCAWGEQFCAADGLSWGPCAEITIPLECAPVETWYSPMAEACCIDQGYCCQDQWDLDGDGDGWESLGNCVDIVCVPEE